MVRVLVCVGLVAAAGLAGCSGLVPMNKDVVPVVGPAPRLNTTPMAPALACIRSQLRTSRRNPRIGVNDFVDGTGVMEGGTQYSRALTQRPDMMLVVALASAGAHLVNRSSVNVAEWELKQAMDKKLGDGRKEMVEGQSVTFRPIRAGVILGSTDYVSGAITELNWNISSGVAEAGAYSAGIGKRVYRISLAIDLMVTDTQSTEIVYAKSFKKQLVGFETNANFFRFVNQDSALQVVSLGTAAASTATQALELFSANLGEKQNEPTQVALRWVVELAAYDIMRKLTHAGQSCDSLLPPGTFDDGVAPPRPAFPTKAAATESGAPMEQGSKAASVGAPATEKPVVEARSEAPGQAKVAPAASTEESSANEAAAEPEAPMEQASKAASVSAPATEKPVVEARAEMPAPKQAKVTPSASTSSANGAAAMPEGLARFWHRLVAPKQAKAPPSASTEESSAKEAAAEPEATMEQASNAASVSAPATEKPVVEARAEMPAPEQAKVTPSVSMEMSSANGVATEPGTPISLAAPGTEKPVVETAPKAKVRTMRDSKTANVQAAGSEKKRIVESRAKLPAAKRAETTPSAAAEKSSGNAQPQAQSNDGGAPVVWMSGSVAAPKPEFSRVGQAGGVQ